MSSPATGSPPVPLFGFDENCELTRVLARSLSPRGLSPREGEGKKRSLLAQLLLASSSTSRLSLSGSEEEGVSRSNSVVEDTADQECPSGISTPRSDAIAIPCSS